MTATWKVSGKWASHEIDCTLHGIANHCGGKCCRGQTFWPARATAEDACGNLGPNGCRLGAERPITCLLYPFRLRGNSLGLHGRTLLPQAGYCAPCHHHGGQTIGEAMRPSFTILFGAEQAERVAQASRRAEDTYVEVPDWVLEALMAEDAWEGANMVPPARAQMVEMAPEIALTPVERVGSLWVKRDDTYRSPGGAMGGKARTCTVIARRALREGAPGLVTAASMPSPQAAITAEIGQALGLPVRVHTPEGKPSEELERALSAGAERITHRPGYNNVLGCRARQDAEASGWALVPFGMETPEAIRQTGAQVRVPPDAERLVMAVGSGMSLAGVLAGLPRDFPVLAVQVGAQSTRCLDRYAPDWRERPVDLVPAEVPYHTPRHVHVGETVIDPIYEAKCAPFLRPHDLFWVVGIRRGYEPPPTAEFSTPDCCEDS